MYLESLKRVVSTKSGLRLTFSSGKSEEQVELSQEAAAQTLRALQGAGGAAGEGPLTLGVLGHQVVRTADAYGLLLRTRELGEVVFALPLPILKVLIGDLMHLESSPPARPASHAADVARASGKTGARQSQS
ncbi:MAG: hypothetical protein AB7G54_03950 [Methyloceanibacter sp.]